MKILIVTKNWIGDVIFQSPAIQAVRDRFPDAEITCMAPARCLEALRSHPAVDRLIAFDERGAQRSFFQRARLVWRLRCEAYDRAYLFHRSKSRALLLRLGGVKERIGFGKARFFLTRAYGEPPAELHHADRMLWLLRQDGLDAPQKGVYRFYYSAAARAAAADLMKRCRLETGRFVCFHLGANWEPKRWPAAHFAALAEMIARRFHYPVVITGHAGDRALWQDFEKKAPAARVVSLIGQTGLEELAALFRRSAFVVTGDSGPMHLAAASGARVLALFGPTDPELTGPRGPGESAVLAFVPPGFSAPWYGSSLPEGGWLSQISAAAVFDVLLKKGWAQALAAAADEEPLAAKSAMTEEERRVRRILWVTLSNIGDVILTTPVLRALIGRFPQAEVTAVVGPRARDVLVRSSWIKRTVIYNKRGGLAEKLRFVQELRRETYDLVVDLRGTAIPWLVRTHCRSPLLRRHKATAMRERHLEVLAMTGIGPGPRPPFEFFNSADAAALQAKLAQKGVRPDKGLILMAPAAASELKTWPLAGFEAVLRRLLAQTPDTVLILGDQRERALTQSLTAVDPERVILLAGELALPETAALIARARLVMANDSALMHLAFELGTPAVAVFGPTDPEKYGHAGEFFKIVRAGSPCSPCEKPRCRFERQHCFEDLNPETAARACEELLHDFCPSR